MENNEKVLEVDRYLVIFLKFVQTVIPTIQYDFTQNVFMWLEQFYFNSKTKAIKSPSKDSLERERDK